MARTVTGVDIGQRSSELIRGFYKGNTFHVTDFEVAPAGSDDVRAAWTALGVKATSARIGLSGRDVNIRYTRVPRVPDWQLRNLMRFEVEEIGDQSGSDVASDFNLLPDLPEVEGEDVVLLAMARQPLLDAHQDGLKSVGGTLEAFSPSAIALYNAWTRYGVVEDDTVLIANVGHDNIDVVIARGPDLLFARNLSGGSRLFDDAISQRFNMKPDSAEKLKIEMANIAPNAKYATPNHERASRALLGAAGQLLSLLQSTVLFCKSQVKISGLKIDRVQLCGGGAALEGLCEYLSAGMNVPVELFDAFRVVDTSALDPATADKLDEFKLESVVALGLATMASDPESYSLEILPPEIEKARKFWGGTIWLIAAAVLAVLYLGFDAYHESTMLDKVRGDNRTVAEKLRRANRTHKDAVALIDENQVLHDVAIELQTVLGSGEQIARTLTLLDQHLPRDFWVAELASGWSYDDNLGVDRNGERPILSVKGRVRQGTESPAVMHQSMIAAMTTALPSARINQALHGSTFSLDLTLFADAPVAAVDQEVSE